MSKRALNVGCGPSSRWIPGTEGLDIQDFGQKYVASVFDFEPDKPYDIVHAHHLIEHFQDTVELMEKLGALVKKGGILDIRVPTLPYPHAHVDPTHLKFIPKEATAFFGYFTDKSLAGHCYTKCKFEIIGFENDRFEWEAHVIMRKLE